MKLSFIFLENKISNEFIGLKLKEVWIEFLISKWVIVILFES